MSRKRPPSPPTPPSQPTAPEITRSATIQDRASTFLALYSPTIPPRTLQSHESIATASHRILAWRKPSAQRSLAPSQRLYDTGYDDDGEKYAGKKLEKIIDDMGAEGAIVVARWYGGVMLGPVRFTHIESVAREAIRMGLQGVLGEGGAVEDTAAKKRRIEGNDEESRGKLVAVLRKRDQSIGTLRLMLAELMETAAGVQGSQGAEVHKLPAKPQVDYGAMTLPVLQRLEKARDATIAWILKEIDKAEGKSVMT